MFSEHQEDVNDVESAGYPSTSITNENIYEVTKMILANRRITVRDVAEDRNMSIGRAVGFCQSFDYEITSLVIRTKISQFCPEQHRNNTSKELLGLYPRRPKFASESDWRPIIGLRL